MPMSDPIPFKRKVEQMPDIPGNLFTRLVAAKALAGFRHKPASDIIEEMWPSDIFLKAASAPAQTTVTGWAAELAHKVVVDAISSMGSASGGAQLLAQGLVLSFNGAGQISAPGFVASAGNAGFVAENAPIPVRQLSVSPAVLLPYKIATIAVMTREMMESGNAEKLISDTLVRSCGPALDVALFDNNAATAARPAGLRNGITTSTPSSSTDPFGACFEDVATLVNAVSTVAGSGPVALVCNAGRALMVRARISSGVQQPWLPVYASNAVGNDLIAVAPEALVAAFSADPEVDTSTSGTLHMDTAPVADPGSTGTHKSLFQTESIAIKVRWPISWALRNAAGVAWLTPTWK
jgi:hypothetical protein